MSVKPEMDAAIHSAQFHSSKTAIVYYTLCSAKRIFARGNARTALIKVSGRVDLRIVLHK